MNSVVLAKNTCRASLARQAYTCSLVTLGLCAFTSVAHAQSNEQDEDNSGFVIQADALLGNDSNVQRNAFGESGQYAALAPKLSLIGIAGKHRYEANYEGEYRQYNDLSDFSFANHAINLASLLDLSLKSTVELKASYEAKVEDPATINSLLNDFEEFTEINRAIVSASYIYGSVDSIGQIVVSGELGTVEFNNNQQAFRDNDNKSLSTQFFYRLAPNSRLLFEISASDFDFVNEQASAGFNQSSFQTSYLIGADWRLSEQVNALAKIGYQQRDFDDDSIENVDGLTYSLDANWAFRERTSLNVGASRTANDSPIANEPSLTSTSFNVGINHEVSELTTLSFTYTISQDDFNQRSDTNNDAELSLAYALTDKITATAAYEFQDRDSDFENFSFTSHNVQLVFTFELG